MSESSESVSYEIEDSDSCAKCGSAIYDLVVCNELKYCSMICALRDNDAIYSCCDKAVESSMYVKRYYIKLKINVGKTCQECKEKIYKRCSIRSCGKCGEVLCGNCFNSVDNYLCCDECW